MAEVFRASEPRSVGEPRVVVVKRMLPALASEPGARAMFEEEARLGAFVQHGNVVRVLGLGEEGSQPYLVLELVPGLDLWRFTRWLRQRSRQLGTELSLFVVRELLAGLHAVHEARDDRGLPLGLVHRDVSPSNVLLSVHGDVKLGDFGIAQALLRESYPQATMSDRAKGKLGYLAPEQVRGLSADRRADVFAAAVIAAELLMGRPLFAGGSELAVLLAIRDAQIRPFDEIAGTLPRGLADVVRAALARDPDVRIATAAELASRLARFSTVPAAALRTELAGLVAEGSGARRPSGQMPVIGSDAPGSDRITMVDPETTPIAIEVEGEGEITADAPELRYYVRQSDGSTHGPMSYAKLVEAVATRGVGLVDEVALEGQGWKSLAECPDLLRHVPASSLSERTREQRSPGAPDHEHTLEGSPGIVGPLALAVLAKETGLLLCEQGSMRKEIYLAEGVPEFVTSNLASELLGEFLVARGVISRGELDMALAVMPRFEGRLGDTLTALGLVEAVHLFQQIAAQVQEKLLELFTWSAGHASFYRGVAKPQSGFPLGLEPWRILMDGIDRRIAQGLEHDTLVDRRDSLVQAARPAPRGFATAAVPTLARRIVERAVVPATVARIARENADPTRRDPTRGAREVVLLLAMGALRWVE